MLSLLRRFLHRSSRPELPPVVSPKPIDLDEVRKAHERDERERRSVRDTLHYLELQVDSIRPRKRK